jgi:hypothetical protein
MGGLSLRMPAQRDACFYQKPARVTAIWGELRGEQPLNGGSPRGASGPLGWGGRGGQYPPDPKPDVLPLRFTIYCTPGPGTAGQANALNHRHFLLGQGNAKIDGFNVLLQVLGRHALFNGGQQLIAGQNIGDLLGNAQTNHVG